METHEGDRKKAILCGLGTQEGTASLMKELGELAETAGAEVVAAVVQNRDAPDAATMLGEGKLREIAGLCREEKAEMLIFDDELSGTQIRNIEDITGVRAIDRTALILDIFAKRARSREGRLQVELAQLQYMAPRLAGMRPELSRLGGGIGTRGPGEKKLETDRRHIRRRMRFLERSIAQIASRRQLIRSRRGKDGVPTAALVGYTNAGKSTLLNRLSGADVFVENMLFATLDPTSRAICLPDGRRLLLTDTVGFIRKLPHELVDAFHSTLEEAAQADLILNVCDISDPAAGEQLRVSEEILKELGCGETPQLIVLNKCDRAAQSYLRLDGRESVRISAGSGEGIDSLLAAIAGLLPKKREKIKLLLPYEKAGLDEIFRRSGAVYSAEYTPEGIAISGEIDTDRAHLFSDYRI